MPRCCCIIDVARYHDDFKRNTAPLADIVDIIIVAQLTLSRIPEPLQYNVEATLLPSFAKLGLYTPSILEENQEFKKDFVKAYELLAS